MHLGLKLQRRRDEPVRLVEHARDRHARARAVDDVDAPEAVVPPAGLPSDGEGEDPHAEIARAGGPGLSEHDAEPRRLPEDAAAEQSAVEAGKVVDGGVVSTTAV